MFSDIAPPLSASVRLHMATDFFVASFAWPVAIFVGLLVALNAIALTPLSRRFGWVTPRRRAVLGSVFLVVLICGGWSVYDAWQNLVGRVQEGIFTLAQARERWAGWSFYMFVLVVPFATLLTGLIWGIVLFFMKRPAKS